MTVDIIDAAISILFDDASAPRRGRGKAQKTIDLIDAAIGIAEEIQPCSVRAICYRLFVAGLIPSMAKPETDRVGRHLVDAREQGLLPWPWIVDETRKAEGSPGWRDPRDLFAACVQQYRKDYWQDQKWWVEVWSEKGTIRGTLAPVLDEYGVKFRVMHGHASATALHDVAEMVQRSDKHLHVLYIGDRDPSGMHMSEVDLPERLARYGATTDDVSIIRVAIADDDTYDEDDCPSFPAADKFKDKRQPWYVKTYGPRCWELDALSPAILRERIKNEITEYIEVDAWNHSIAIEAAERESLTAYVKGYPSIVRARLRATGCCPCCALLSCPWIQGVEVHAAIRGQSDKVRRCSWAGCRALYCESRYHAKVNE